MDKIIQPEFDHEMEHIPQGSPDSAQETFRRTFFELRSSRLRDDPDANPAETLQEALRVFHEAHPGIAPQYDKEYFS